MVALNELRDKAYKIACDHGFHKDDLSDEHFLMLVITELSEVVEADRKGGRASTDMFNMNCNTAQTDKEHHWTFCFEHFIKDTVEDELADTVIRLMDLAGLRNINILLFGKWSADLTKITLTEAVFSIVRELFNSDSSSPLEKNLKSAATIFSYNPNA